MSLLPPWLRTAFALALGAGLSLGLARFAYALQLPAMRADLGWGYATAGLLNTVNALGYLLGALAMPVLLRRWGARTLFLAGGTAAAAVLALHALAAGLVLLLPARLLLGMASALSFVTGGLLAARLASQSGARASLVLGLFYGGTGWGIVAASLALPPVLADAARWPWSWALLALLAAVFLALMALGTRTLQAAPAGSATAEGSSWRAGDFAFGLAGYLCFGLGYIGYMTFIVALVREQGAGGVQVAGFFALLGVGVLASSWLWAPLLGRFRDGKPMALLNALLALATLLPLLGGAALFASGLLFGAVFLQVVASTTALVRHNVAPAGWPAGITAFTVVFAAGQIAGPTLVGVVSDGGGLRQGLAVSAGILFCGSLLAMGQRSGQRHSSA
jgi:predicted MFS family arabinose efflux permease